VNASTPPASVVYRETFDDGSRGWYGWISNSAGPKALEYRRGVVTSRSPWWIDYNHAPPGAGYLHMVFCLSTKGPEGEHQYETAGRSQFIAAGCSTNFTNAELKLRVRGELETRGAQLVLLIQGNTKGLTSGWLLTGKPFAVTRDWSETSVVLAPNPSDWTCLGVRHDRGDMYGTLPLTQILANVNVNLMFVLFPLSIAPMGPLEGDPHRLRPGKDYPVWTSRLPEGYVELDTVEIRFAE
jgi:hypothetical protein